MSDGIPGSRADPAAGLRAHRFAPYQAGRDAGASVRRPLRLVACERVSAEAPAARGRVRRLVNPSPHLWSTCTTPTPSAWNGWSTLMDEIFRCRSARVQSATYLPARVGRCWPRRQRSARQCSPVRWCSDETSARSSGKEWWEWVFIGTRAALHVIRPSRAKAVVQALFGEIRPMVWVSDMLGSQRGHAAEWRCAWRICCAMRHTPSNAATLPSARRSSGCCCAQSLSDDAVTRLKDITLPQYLADLDRRLSRIMAAVPIGDRDASCASASPPTGLTCSSSSPIGACRIPTTSPRDISAPA